MKNDHGFSTIEALIIVVILVAISFCGYFVYKKNQNSSSTVVDTTHFEVSDSIDGSTADYQTIMQNFQDVLRKDFKQVSSFICNGMSDGGGCSSPPSNTIAVEQVNNEPSRRVSGYNFYVEPNESDNGLTGISIDALNQPMAKIVVSVLNKQITADHLTSSSNVLQSQPEPGLGQSQITFYSSQTICEIDENQDSGLYNSLLSCAPISDYVSSSAELLPLFNVYIAYRSEFSNPSQTGNWIRFQSNYSGPFITNSSTSGYKRGVVNILDLSPKNVNGTNSGTAFFYAKNNVWTLLLDKQNAYAIPCSYKFTNIDAHTAYMGAKCMLADSSAQTIY